MTAPAHFVPLPPPRRRRAAAWGGVLAAGACLLAAGCSAGGPAGGTPAGGVPAHGPALGRAVARPGAAAAPAGGLSAASGSSAATGAGLTSLPLPGGPSVISTASLSLRSADVQATVGRAAKLAAAAGGYVSGEHTSIRHARRATATVSIQLKVPAAAYPATLAALDGLGTLRAQAQQTRDVTGVVADVNSRVASAQAAIAQLRRLLTRAGTVSGLLSVQEQINAEEAGLEALQSQQRALARETTYATISVVVTGLARPARHQHRTGPAGFLGGLTAGWRALRAAVSWLLTGAGAVLPFAVIAAAAALAALAARRRLARRRAGPSPAQ